MTLDRRRVVLDPKDGKVLVSPMATKIASSPCERVGRSPVIKHLEANPLKPSGLSVEPEWGERKTGAYKV